MFGFLVFIAILACVIGSVVALEERKYSMSLLFGLSSIIITILSCNTLIQI